MNERKQAGFTLIELLVVIAIIALLASIVLIALGGAREKARDATRRGDLRSVQNALELYYADNGAYPSTGNAYFSTANYATSGAGGYIPNLAPTYIAVLPKDPLNGNFIYDSNGTDYKLISQTGGDTCPTTDPLRDPVRLSEPCTLAVYTPGAAGW